MKQLDISIHKQFFMQAYEIAKQATCQRSQCGSILIKNGEVIGTGFNSPAGDEPHRCAIKKNEYNQKVTDKTCCVHAEQRAILDALKKNPGKIKDSTLYFIRIKDGKLAYAGKPYCTICSKIALDAGVKEFCLWHEDAMIAYDTKEYNDMSFSYQD